MPPKFDTCFFERYAKCTLECLLGNHYAHLINTDRPDLQDLKQGIGIEVTRAMSENQHAAHALINQIADKPIYETEADWSEVKTFGYAYGLSTGASVGEKEYKYWLLALPLKRILENKVKKVMNGFYGSFAEMGLYVFSKEELSKEDIENSLHYVIAMQRGSSLRYETLYLSEIHRIHVCDLYLETYQTIDISKSLRRKFYRMAIQNEPSISGLLHAQKHISL